MQSKTPMQIASTDLAPSTTELALLGELLPLAGARVLELGCGLADKTRAIAQRYAPASIVAAEVDQRALAHNLAQPQDSRITFTPDGAQDINLPGDSLDIVLMFKSLHHVPVAALDDALAEIHRVLKPGGLAYISEPVFAGELNEVIRLFHDEQAVRQEAFLAVQRVVQSGLLALVEQRFFTAEVKMRSFAEFADGIINATHSDHVLSDEAYAAVERKFLSYEGSDGFCFATPNRVDLLRKPQAG